MKSQSEIIQLIARQIDEVSLGRVPAASVKPADRILADLGLDSLDYATVMLACERSTGVKLDENRIEWSSIDTVEKLAQLFTRSDA